MKINDVIEKGKEEKKKIKISQHQQRKKEDSTQGEYAYFRLARSAHATGTSSTFRNLTTTRRVGTYVCT